MKIRELKLVEDTKLGHIDENGVKSELNEKATFNHLTLFGLNIELIKPNNTKNGKNPDIFIMGSIWEVKTPTSSNRNTIRNRFREATKQATKIIFDLRFIKKDADNVEQQVIEMFKGGGKVRRMMIIKKNGKIFDFYK